MDPLPVPAPALRSGRLLERETELAVVDQLLREAADGEGRFLLIEGAAGIGKTRIVAESRHRANDAGLQVLAARGSELERDFPFGVVRQLFEGLLMDPETADRLLQGSAAAARPVVAPMDGTDENSGDVSFAALHGLYWLCVNIAGEGALALTVDDLHWCDRPSLRFLAYLGRRLEGLPLLVVGSTRPSEPGADLALLAEIANDPLTVCLRPAALTSAATDAIIEARLGVAPDAEFAAACHRATGGNPLLLNEILAAFAAQGVSPDAAHAGAVVHDIGPRAVARSVAARLLRVPAASLVVARTVAVLGDGTDLRHVAELAGLDHGVAAEATGHLAAAEILRPDMPLGFVHPLVRAAIYQDIAPGERQRQHAQAARLLAEAGAPLDQVAAHLLVSPGNGDEATVDTLLRSARGALARGASESAVSYLERALEEPPPVDRRTALLLELGIAQGYLNGPAAAATLRTVYEEADDPEIRVGAGIGLAHSLLFVGNPIEVTEIAEREIARIGSEDPDLRNQFEAVRLTTAWYDPRALPFDHPDFHRHREIGDGGQGSRMLAGVNAYHWAMTGGSVAECVPLALHCVSGDALQRLDASGVPTVAGILVLLLADHPDAYRVTETELAEGYRTGSIFVASGGYIFHGLNLLLRGELGEAGRLETQARDMQDVWGQHNVRLFPAAYHAEILLEQGDLEGALRTFEWAGLPPDSQLPDSPNFSWWLNARLRYLIASGALEDAVALSLDCERRFSSTIVNPAFIPWRSLRAEALHRLGRSGEAVAIAESELPFSRAWGAARTVGRSLRVLGAVSGDLDVLREAVEVLEQSTAKLELAKALAAYGIALRLDRQPTEAREPLRRALDLASVCEATPLVEHIRSEIYATGARPRTDALSGIAALTASERRVADMASGGQSNKDIAQALYVTPKTVEVHLGNVYRKLGIKSRRDLAGALAA
jgi:DNA-binding CsgD family transcriptional regulator